MNREDKAIEFFLQNIERTSDCWFWTGIKNKSGYGISKRYRYETLAHRISFLFYYGKMKRKMLVCHHCDNPSCVNPAHLFLGTHQDNMRDKTEKNRAKPLWASSKYRGVIFDKRKNKWKAYIKVGKKYKRITHFDYEIDAAIASDYVSLCNFGLKIPINFPSFRYRQFLIEYKNIPELFYDYHDI